MPDQDGDAPEREVATPPVPVVDAVEALKVGLHRVFMGAEKREEADYSPADANPSALAIASITAPYSRTRGARPVLVRM